MTKLKSLKKKYKELEKEVDRQRVARQKATEAFDRALIAKFELRDEIVKLENKVK